ncbi:MAG: glutamine synthetase type III, partial [Candidatus Omnitrophica bacterium]|nr:glutamine synthetase type III [Candidatus Omnitrophota bacterium]
TSPLAFTGNKFEFRAVGSSHNCSEAATLLNMILAYGYNEVAEKIAANKTKASIKEKAIVALEEIIKKTKKIRFEGNNYEESWHKEAEKRKLPNTKTTPEALELFLTDKAAKFYEQFDILSKKELHSKVEIKLEAYIKTKDIEFKIAANIVKTMVLPAVLKQIALLSDAEKGIKLSGSKLSVFSDELKEIGAVYDNMQKGLIALLKVTVQCEKEKDVLTMAKLYADKGAQALKQLRSYVDKAEEIVSDEFWPMAKYQELLIGL